MRGDVQKRLSHEPLNSYYPVVKWATVRLMLILKFILGLQSQIIDFTNVFTQADNPSREPVFIEITRYFNSNGGQCDFFIRLNKGLYGQSEAAHIWYEKFKNGLLDRCFVVSNMNHCMFIAKNVICVVYVDDCLFWASSQ